MKRIVIICVWIIGCIMLGCSHSNYSNMKADDAFSKAIYKELGAKDIYYQGKTVTAENIIFYKYLLYYEKAEMVEQLVAVANQTLEEEGTDEKIILGCYIPVPGGKTLMLTLRNYSDGIQDGTNFTCFQICNISGTDIVETMYNEPSTYYNLPDIKVLIIEGKMAKITQEQNIDWAAYYPDLDKLEVILDEDSH